MKLLIMQFSPTSCHFIHWKYGLYNKLNELFRSWERWNVMNSISAINNTQILIFYHGIDSLIHSDGKSLLKQSLWIFNVASCREWSNELILNITLCAQDEATWEMLVNHEFWAAKSTSKSKLHSLVFNFTSFRA
jgi:hypothetical protein